MPQAVPYIAAYVYTAFAAAGWTGAAAWATAVAVTYAAGAYAISRATAALAPGKPKQKGGGLQLNYSGTTEPRRTIYGEVKVGGMQVIPPIAVEGKGEYLHFVVAVAGHEVYSIGDVYFDANLIPSGIIGAVSGTLTDGAVSSGNYKGLAWVRRYLGTSTQTADAILQSAYPAAFTTDFRGRGVAYIALRLKEHNKVFASGVPTVTAMVKGKQCYDPRSSTTAWTDNPALHVRDFLVNEVGFSTDQIDDSLAQAAANVCDQTVNIPGATTEKRFTSSMVLSAADGWESNLQSLLDSMHGRAVYRDGKWRIYAGAWEAPAVTITQADWVSPVQVQASLGREERWNAVRVWFVDKSRKYERTECYIRTNPSYQAQDGGERIYTELELPGVSGEYQAQRHAELALRSSRNQLKIAGKLRPEFIKLSTWDSVYVTDPEFGWSAKTFRVATMDMAPDGSVEVSLVEESSTMWADMDAADYGVPSAPDSIDPTGGLGGVLVVDPYMRNEQAWWSTYSDGAAVDSYDTSCVSYNPAGGVNSEGSWLIKANGTSLNEITLQLTSVVTPAFKFVTGQAFQAVARFKVHSEFTYDSGYLPSAYTDVIKVGAVAFDPNSYGDVYTNIPDMQIAKTGIIEPTTYAAGIWFELSGTVIPENLSDKYKVPRQYVKALLRISYGKRVTAGMLELDAFDMIPSGGGVTFANTTDVRSGSLSDAAIAPDIAALELDRLWVASQHNAGKGTKTCELGNVSGTIVVNCSSSNVFRMKLIGATALTTSNQLDGQFINLRIKQNGTGGHTFSFPAYAEVVSGQTIALGADKKSLVGMQWDSVDSMWDAMIRKGW